MERRFFKKYKKIDESNKVDNLNHGSKLQRTANKLSTYVDLASNLTSALLEWQKAGRPVVTSEQWTKRLNICRGCEFWSEIKQTQIAKCKKCGCSSGKLLLSTSRCPLNPPRWGQEI